MSHTVRFAAFFLFFVIFLTFAFADNAQNVKSSQKNTTTTTTKTMSTNTMTNTNTVNSNSDSDDDDDDDDEEELICRWKWSRWSICTKNCNSGNTTRRGLCYCTGSTVPVADSMCEGSPSVEGLYDVVPCNEQGCTEKPPCNKICWMNLIKIRRVINMTDGIYNCSQGCPSDSSCPRGKYYSQILDEPIPATDNAEWYYLAKEWYSAVLNTINGVTLSPLAIQTMGQARDLLEDCNGWGPDQMKIFAHVYATKEKLNRANNGIGGLGEVDQQVTATLMAGGVMMEGGDDSEGSSHTPSFLVLSVVVPLMVLILALTVLASWVYYRRRSNVVVAHAEFNSDDDDTVVQHIPLQPVVVHGDAVDSESEDKAD